MSNIDWDQIAVELLGLTGEEFGKGFMGGAHVGGRVIATLFGGAGLADAAERLEDPILPDWAKKGGAADVSRFVPAGLGLSAVTASKEAKAAKAGKGAIPEVSKITDITKSMAQATTKDHADFGVWGHFLPFSQETWTASSWSPSRPSAPA